MLKDVSIRSRLQEMRRQDNPALRWDENCEGSARALVVFVGPSPGSSPYDRPGRRPIRRNCHAALWNESYLAPLKWSPGFRASFKPLVEALLLAPYATASKLIGRANLDFLGNPQSKDVSEEGMREGAPSVLRMIAKCSPEIVVPMDKKSFWFLREFMQAKKFTIAECPVQSFEVRISKGSKKRHRDVYCFRATSPAGHSMVVVKLPQHPAKILQADYGARCGKAIRVAAQQVAEGQAVSVRVT